MARWMRVVAAAVLAPLVLGGCLFLPGKFASALVIHADRSFSFTYQGEVVALDPGKSAPGLNPGSADGEEAPPPEPEPSPEEKLRKKAEDDAKFREIAAQLSKEAGYRKVEYRGDGVFWVDYAIAGRLTHNFVYPYNLDGAMIFPWIAIELRGGDTVRVKAPGFAKQDGDSMGMASELGKSKLDGIFTLTTDAEVVSQNQEDGAEIVGSDRVITWKVTPLTQDAPTAVLRVKPL